jgi:hypothetical protein
LKKREQKTDGLVPHWQEMSKRSELTRLTPAAVTDGVMRTYIAASKRKKTNRDDAAIKDDMSQYNKKRSESTTYIHQATFPKDYQ